MEPPEVAQLDESRITSESRRFAADLFARFPDLRPHASMERQQGEEVWTVVVEVPAPSGDPRSRLVVWMNGDEPSVTFGDWHTHEGFQGGGSREGSARAALLDLIAGIFADRMVLCEGVAGASDGHITLLDLEWQDALLEELTSKYSPGRARLRSWTGRLDREIGLADLEEEDPA